jgi:Fe-S-cluster containining protein
VSYTPVFRDEISVNEAPDGRFILRDDLFGRELVLDPVLRTVSRAVNGQRTVEAVLLAAIEGGITRPIAMRALRSLLLLNVFEQTGTEAVEALRARRDGLELMRGAVLPEARFECQGSGSCCRAYSLGPIAPEDEARILALPLSKFFPAAQDTFFESQTLPNGGTVRQLRRVDGHCVFLDDDSRCGLHTHFGGDAKPHTCRLFPLSHVVRYDGAHIYDRGECSRFSTSSRKGEPLARTPQRLLPVMRQERRLEHPIVQIASGTVVDYAFYAPLVQLALDESTIAGITAPEVLRALARRVVSFTSVLDELPIAPSGPSTALAHVLSIPRARFYVPSRPDNLVPGYKAASMAADALVRACDLVLNEVQPGHPQEFAREHVRQVKPILHQIRELTASLAASRPVPERMIAMGFISTDTPEVHDVLRISLRQGLFGRHCLVDDRALPALVRLAFVELVTLFGARAEASSDASRMVVGSLDAAHTTAQRAFGHEFLWAVFRESTELAPALLEALPYLTRWR